MKEGKVLPFHVPERSEPVELPPPAEPTPTEQRRLYEDAVTEDLMRTRHRLLTHYLREGEPNDFYQAIATFSAQIKQKFKASCDDYKLWPVLALGTVEARECPRFDFPDEYSVETFIRSWSERLKTDDTKKEDDLKQSGSTAI